MSAPLTERDFDLIEVALESAAQAVQSGATLRSRAAELDPLAAEYLNALRNIRKFRRQK